SHPLSDCSQPLRLRALSVNMVSTSKQAPRDRSDHQTGPTPTQRCDEQSVPDRAPTSTAPRGTPSTDYQIPSTTLRSGDTRFPDLPPARSTVDTNFSHCHRRAPYVFGSAPARVARAGVSSRRPDTSKYPHPTNHDRTTRSTTPGK